MDVGKTIPVEHWAVYTNVTPCRQQVGWGTGHWMIGWLGDWKEDKGSKEDWPARSHSCGVGFSFFGGVDWEWCVSCAIRMAPWVPWLSHFCTALSWAKHWRSLAHLPVELKLGSASASALQRRCACPPCLANSYSLVPRQELSWLCALHSVTCCVPNSWLINAI